MIQNQWYVGTASSQLKDTPFSTQIGEQKIVLFRDGDNKAKALLDRCCHRGFPLSKSKLKDGNIACGYHGWEYNGSGQCVKIPSQSPEKPIPSSYCVQSFPCEEKDGYVWVWMGNEQPKAAAPALPEFSNGKWMQGSRLIQCNYLRALEITFDSPHVYFAHPTHPATIAAKKFGLTYHPQEMRVTDNGCIYFGPPAESENTPIPKDAFRIEFTLPGLIRFEMPGMFQGAYMIFFTTPLTNDSCRMDWSLVNMGAVDTPERVLWTGEGREVIEEDQVILENVQKTYEKEGETFEKSVESDIPTLALRKIVQQAEKGEWPSKDLGIPKRKLLSIVGPTRFG